MQFYVLYFTSSIVISQFHEEKQQKADIPSSAEKLFGVSIYLSVLAGSKTIFLLE